MYSILESTYKMYGGYPIACIYKKAVKDDNKELCDNINKLFSAYLFDEHYSLDEWNLDHFAPKIKVNTHVIPLRQYYVKMAWLKIQQDTLLIHNNIGLKEYYKLWSDFHKLTEDDKRKIGIVESFLEIAQNGTLTILLESIENYNNQDF